MAKARLIHRSKLIYPDGAIREMVIWELPRTTRGRKHSLKYRLYYGNLEGECLIRYDNETGKGDHQHIHNREMPYLFISVEQLISDFQKDIDHIRKNK